MTITYHNDVLQGSEEWIELRRGKLTASTMKRLLTAEKQQKANNKSRYAFMCELLAQRVTGHVEASYMNDNMMRGTIDEEYALAIYAEQIAPIERCGFIENDDLGFPIGFSPDALVGDDGLVEVKSHRPGLQVAQIISGMAEADHMLQYQTGLFVSKRKWIDCIAYAGGFPMQVIRVRKDRDLHCAIENAAIEFEEELQNLMEEYRDACEGMIMTERQVYGEMI